MADDQIQPVDSTSAGNTFERSDTQGASQQQDVGVQNQPNDSSSYSSGADHGDGVSLSPLAQNTDNSSAPAGNIIHDDVSNLLQNNKGQHDDSTAITNPDGANSNSDKATPDSADGGSQIDPDTGGVAGGVYGPPAPESEEDSQVAVPADDSRGSWARSAYDESEKTDEKSDGRGGLGGLWDSFAHAVGNGPGDVEGAVTSGMSNAANYVNDNVADPVEKAIRPATNTLNHFKDNPLAQIGLSLVTAYGPAIGDEGGKLLSDGGKLLQDRVSGSVNVLVSTGDSAINQTVDAARQDASKEADAVSQVVQATGQMAGAAIHGVQDEAENEINGIKEASQPAVSDLKAEHDDESRFMEDLLSRHNLWGAWQDLHDTVADAGKIISDSGNGVQNFVDAVGNREEQLVDQGIDSFENSSIGDNAVVHSRLENIRDYAHFGAGALSGATTFVSGTAGIAGGILQYSSDGQIAGGVEQYFSDGDFRDKTDKTILISLLEYQTGQLQANMGNQIVSAFEKDPFHAIGYAAGMIGSTVLTGGAGIEGDAGSGSAVASDVADGTEMLSPADVAAGGAAEVASDVKNGAGTASELMDAEEVAAPARSADVPEGIPDDATDVRIVDSTHYSFVGKDGKTYTRRGENYQVTDGDFFDFKARARANPNGMRAQNIKGRYILLHGATDEEADTIFTALKQTPVADILDNAQNIYVVDHIGYGANSNWEPIQQSYIGGYAGVDPYGIILSRETLEEGIDKTRYVFFHETFHNRDVLRGFGAHGITEAPGSPFGKGTGSWLAQTNAPEDGAETQAEVLESMRKALSDTGDYLYYLRMESDPSLQAKYTAILQEYGINISFLK